MIFSISNLQIKNSNVTMISVDGALSETVLSVDERGLRSFIVGELKQKRNVLLSNNNEEADAFIKKNQISPYHHYSKNFLFVNFVLKNQFSTTPILTGPMEPKSFSNLLSSISSELAAQVQKLKS
jgi:hypothetical protein